MKAVASSKTMPCRTSFRAVSASAAAPVVWFSRRSAQSCGEKRSPTHPTSSFADQRRNGFGGIGSVGRMISL